MSGQQRNHRMRGSIEMDALSEGVLSPLAIVNV